LHQCLEGEAILVSDISKLDTPLEYFFGGTIAHNLGEVATHCRPLILHFRYKVEFFFHLLELKMLNNSFSSIFIKDFGGPFTLVKKVCLNDGQHFEAFLLATIERKLKKKHYKRTCRR
jgi:hypothetical protein